MGKVTAKSLANLRPWQPGNSANPAGRPVGSRSKLNELALKLLHADFAIHGEETIRRVRERKPEVYLASVVSLLPKQAEKIASPFVDLSDEELEQLEHLLAAMRAKTIQDISAHARGTEPRFNERPRIGGRFAPRPDHSTNHSKTGTEQPTALNGHGNEAGQESQEASVSRETPQDATPSASDTGRAVSQDGSI